MGDGTASRRLTRKRVKTQASRRGTRFPRLPRCLPSLTPRSSCAAAATEPYLRGTPGRCVSFNHSLAGIPRGRLPECLRHRPRLYEPFLEGHLDRAERAAEASERIAGEARDHVKVDVKDVLPTVPTVV